MAEPDLQESKALPSPDEGNSTSLLNCDKGKGNDEGRDKNTISSSSYESSNTSLLARGKAWWSRWRNNGNASNSMENASDTTKKVPYLNLFRFASKQDKFMMVVACISAILHGAIFPFVIVVWGNAINQFENVTQASGLTSEVGKRSAIVLGLGGLSFVLSTLQVALQSRAAQKQGARIRQRYMESLMRQDFTWHDRTENSSGALTARVAGDVQIILSGIGDKVTSTIQFFSMFFVALVVAFVYSWKVTLVLLSSTPVLLVAGIVLAKVASEETSEGQKAYGKAGAVAQEALSLIRTVTAFGGQEIEIERYDVQLDSAYKTQVRQGNVAGIGMGISNFVMFAVYGISFWYGGTLVRRKEINIGDLFSAFFSMVEAAFGLGLAAPHFKAFGAAQGSAGKLWEVIDRRSEIDPLSTSGRILEAVSGRIVFEEVSFAYAGRKDHSVLDGIDMEFLPGKTHAIVGGSGCGKSTIVRLIERFYDPGCGSIKIDGVNLMELNVQWLRSQIGFVSQTPTLFAATIRENIAFGAAMDQSDDLNEKLKRQEVCDKDIVDAAKLANAHQFIIKLPDGYSTMLGERGAKLSGGQKQRIAIARCLIRQPRILILDEATSALDAKSEREVQDALENARRGRTTIIVAHRLSTVRDADTISVVRRGKIAEQGIHEELSKSQGEYQKLINLQQIHSERKQAEGEQVAVYKEQADDQHMLTKLVGKQFPLARTSKSVETQESIDDIKGEKPEMELPAADSGVLRRTFGLCVPEWYYILGGVVGASVAGASWPFMALVFAEASNEILMENRSSKVRFWSLMFLAVGGASFVGTYFQYSLLSVSGERLARRIRSKAFRALMRQEIGFFDQRQNAVGALSTRLATEASSLKETAGDSLGVICFAAASLIVGLIVSFTGCAQVAGFVLGLIPFVVLGGVSQMKVVVGFDAGTRKHFASSGSIVSEALDNIRTVTSLGVQDIFLDRHKSIMEKTLAYGQRGAVLSGLSFGLAEFLVPGLWGASFWLGARFVENSSCDFLGLLKAVSGVIFAAMMIGNVSLRFPDVASAKVAATNFFRLCDRDSEIDPSSSQGDALNTCDGAVNLTDACFEYPTRRSVPVIRGMNLNVQPATTIACVGASGCGKSTVIALIERFYDLTSGSLSVDTKDIRSLNLSSLRSKMGIVSQEPDLFDASVKSNISYGFTKEELTLVTEQQIIDAAKAANAHDFIMELENGYGTILGERGELLSGGQRQRIAIARCLVRNPPILLLDEATSALDAKSESAVQITLDSARRGRTCILVAHRLSTVIDSDAIAMIRRGKVVEMGTHAELMGIKGGEYEKLVRYQMSAPRDKLLPKDE